MHPRGRIEDPGTRAEAEAIAARAGTFAILRPPAEARVQRLQTSKLDPAGLWLVMPPETSAQTSKLDPAALQLRMRPETAALVSPATVASLSSYDHARGARDGALIGGVAGLVARFAWGLVPPTPTCSDNCGDSSAPSSARHDAILFGTFVAAGAFVGAALGALIGHEDRYVYAAPESP